MIWGDNRLASSICLLISSQLSLMKWKQRQTTISKFSLPALIRWSALPLRVTVLQLLSVSLVLAVQLCSVFPRSQNLVFFPWITKTNKLLAVLSQLLQCVLANSFLRYEVQIWLYKMWKCTVYPSSPLSMCKCSIKLSFHCLRVLLILPYLFIHYCPELLTLNHDRVNLRRLFALASR